MDMIFKVIKGPSKKKVLKINKKDVIIGRSKECTITIPARGISKQHCRIWEEDGRLFIEDLGSTNGTELNGIKLEQKMSLRNSDHIQLPHFEFELTFATEGETEPALDEMELEVNKKDSEDDALEPLDEILEKDDEDGFDLIDDIDDDDILELDEDDEDLLDELDDKQE